MVVRAHLQRITVSWDYPVLFVRDAFGLAGDELARVLVRREERRHRAAVLIDRGVAAARPTLADEIARWAAAHTRCVELVAPPLVGAGGETAKNDARAPLALAERLRDFRLDRQSFVIAIGGGAFLDLCGYVAALAHRGLRLVRLPSTVLGQADAGVGVKNGINAFGQKNFLGSFAPPWAVVNDLGLLDTLPRRERVAGLAEVVKVALLRDPALFAWLRAHAGALTDGEQELLGHAVERGALAHLEHIATAGDPFELGSARPLDFGHWAAHKLETLTGHALRHGEAVSIGMALDTFYAAEAGLCAPRVADEVADALRALGLPLWHPALDERRADGRRAVLDGLDDFREHLGGELTLTLLHDIGAPFEVHTVDEARLERALAHLSAHAAEPAPRASCG